MGNENEQAKSLALSSQLQQLRYTVHRELHNYNNCFLSVSFLFRLQSFRNDHIDIFLYSLGNTNILPKKKHTFYVKENKVLITNLNSLLS